MKKFLIGFVIFLLVVAVGSYVFLNMGKKVDVTWTEADYESAIEKSEVMVNDIEELNLLTLFSGNFSTNGQNAVDVRFTNAEMSALIDKANANAGPISNFKVAFNGNGEGEISFKLNDRFIDFLKDQNIVSAQGHFANHNYVLSPIAAASGLGDTIVNVITAVAVNKPVYASGSLVKRSNNSVDLNITSLKVGQLSMNQSVIDRVEMETLRFVNTLLSEVNGISIEELRVENGQLYYKGTLPAEIKGVKLQ